MPDHTIPRLIDRIAAVPGERVAIVEANEDGLTRWTYRELLSEASSWAVRLRKAELKTGDTVGLWLPNCAHWLAIELAAASLGLIVVPVNPRLRGKDARDLIEQAQLMALIAPSKSRMVDYDQLLSEVLTPPVAHLGTVIRLGLARPPVEPGGALQPDDGEDRPLNCFSTSGSTGKPKLALHRQSSLVIRFTAAAERFDIRSGDSVLCALPLCGVWGLGISLAALMRGATCVLMPVFDAGRAAGIMRDHAIAHLHGGDNMIREILASPAFEGETMTAWRTCYFGAFTGNPASGTVRLIESSGAPSVRAAQAYGSSEAMAFVAGCAPDAPEADRHLAGGPFLDEYTEARIAGPDGESLAEGEAGEIQLRGRTVMSGYLNAPDATEAAFTGDGWYRTGDLGYALKGGLVFLSRHGDALRLKGNLVDPAEIEHHLAGHPDIAEAHVVGITVPDRGDVAVAFVRSTSPATDETALIAFCKGRIAGFKIPDRIIVTDDIPVTQGANGAKVKKGELRERAQSLFAIP